jgi:cell division protein FtsW
MQVSKSSPSQFSYLLGVALTLFLVLQALINIGVVTGLFPITGIPLTFISYGGSSFVSSLFFVGVLLNISRRVEA